MTNIMKKHLYTPVALAAIILVSCSVKEAIPEIDDQKAEPKTELITITGNVHETIQSKTSYDFSSETEGVFQWVSTDKVGLIVKKLKTSDPLEYNLNNLNLYTLNTSAENISNEGKTAVFSGIFSHDNEGDMWLSTGFAVYPPSLAQVNSNSGYNRVFVKLPSTSTGAADKIYLVGTPDSEETPTNYLFKTATSILQVTVSEIPATATKLRLATFDKKNYPLDGDFSLVKTNGVVTITKDNYLSDWGNGYIDVDVTAKQGSTNETFYFNVPAGSYPANMLILEMYDDSSTLLMQNGINKDITFVRNEVIATPPLTVTAPTWKKLGWGKYIDNQLWSMMKFVDYTSDEIGYVDVLVEQNIADETQFRVLNPYGQAKDYLSYVGLSQAEHSKYLSFSIDSEGQITFDDCQTGFIVDSKNYTIKQTPDGNITYDKLLLGTYTNPSVIQLAPDYYGDDVRTNSRNGSNNMVRLVFPSLVNSATGSVTVSGNAKFASGMTYYNNASKMSVFVSSTSLFDYYNNRWGDNSGSSEGVSTKSTNKTASSGTLTAGNLGVNTSYFANSMPLYLYWYTYDASGNKLMSGCRKFFYLASTDETTIAKTFTAATAEEMSAAGANNTPSFYYNPSFCSDPENYTITFEVSDDLTKGNIMCTNFCGIDGKAYGMYYASKGNQLVLYINEPFCTTNGEDYVLREYYSNGPAKDYYTRGGIARFLFNKKVYNVNSSFACNGETIGLTKDNVSTWSISVTRFVSDPTAAE